MLFAARMKELGLALIELLRPSNRFVPAVQVGNLVFVSGQIPAVSGQPTRRSLEKRGNTLVRQSAWPSCPWERQSN